jgi:two-component system cell cycle sensor histidine kinase/response regulator CckA
MDKTPAGTVLVVEDHDSVRVAITRFLTTGGFKVLEAATTAAAKAIWQENANRISLLLVDIDLGGASGPDLVEELRPKVPVIFATATEDAVARKATRKFANPIVLHKPFSPELLVKTVRDTLSAPTALSGFTGFYKRPTAPAKA